MTRREVSCCSGGGVDAGGVVYRSRGVGSGGGGSGSGGGGVGSGR